MPSTNHQKMPARAAAKVVLLEAGRPMHYREIAKRAIDENLVRVRGGDPLKEADPEATMKTIRSFLCGETQRAERGDGESDFVRVDAGVYDLRPTVIAAAKMSEMAKARLTAEQRLARARAVEKSAIAERKAAEKLLRETKREDVTA